MRILVASGFEAGSLLAHAINTVKMAEGFAKLGHEVTILCRRPRQGRADEARLSSLYGLSAPLAWIQLPAHLGRHPLDQHTHFMVQALAIVLRARPDLLYARNYMLPWAATALRIPTVAESHAEPDAAPKPLTRMLSATRRKTFRALVTIADVLAKNYGERGCPAEKILVLPDAVDLALFRAPENRRRGSGRVQPSVAYAGHLYDYKGIPTVLAAAERMPHVRFDIVGGTRDDVARCATIMKERRLENVLLHGMKPHAEVPRYLWAADALLLPPSAQHPSARWTSPVKLGEYLAAGRPIIASDIPALRAWLSDREADFFAPDDPAALAQAIERVLADPAYATALSEAGARKAESLSYEARAAAILRFVAHGERPIGLTVAESRAKATGETQKAFCRAVESLQPGDIAIDCGANVGEFAEMLASTGATVHAFEPNPYAFAELKRRFEGRGNVILHEAAVDASGGRARLYLHARAAEAPLYWSEGSSLLSGKVNVDPQAGLEVDCLDLAAFLSMLDRPPKVLKLDIEGAEARVLERLIDRGLHRAIGDIFVETHERKIPEIRPAIAKLRALVSRAGLDNIHLDWE